MKPNTDTISEAKNELMRDLNEDHLTSLAPICGFPLHRMITQSSHDHKTDSDSL